jgi:hypothetical protein
VVKNNPSRRKAAVQTLSTVEREDFVSIFFCDSSTGGLFLSRQSPLLLRQLLDLTLLITLPHSLCISSNRFPNFVTRAFHSSNPPSTILPFLFKPHRERTPPVPNTDTQRWYVTLYPYSWGRGRTPEESKQAAKKAGGRGKAWFTKVLPEGAGEPWVDNFGGICWTDGPSSAKLKYVAMGQECRRNAKCKQCGGLYSIELQRPAHKKSCGE